MTGKKFRAPRGGIYRFSISANSGQAPTKSDGKTAISVKLNRYGVPVEDYVSIFDASLQAENNISFTWMMKLKAGDWVELHVSESWIISSCMYPLTFTGELLENKKHLIEIFHDM